MKIREPRRVYDRGDLGPVLWGQTLGPQQKTWSNAIKIGKKGQGSFQFDKQQAILAVNLALGGP